MGICMSIEHTEQILLNLRKAKYAEDLNQYNENPKTCLNCRSVLSFKNRHHKYCCITCRRIKNRALPKTNPICPSCGQISKYYGNSHWATYCSACIDSGKHIHKKTPGTVPFSELKTDATRRHWIILLRGHKCEICGLTEWTGKIIPLQLDHIDGNSRNNVLENCRVICPNCDALLPTYKGNGRFLRRLRNQIGLSS